MLTSNQLEKLQQILHKQQESLVAHLQQNDHFDLESEAFQETVGELSNYDNHPGDSATDLYEREKDIALNEHAEQELKDVVKALYRMSSGDYGTCEECGKEIAYERLEALPTTKYCKEHSRDKLEHEQRPVEEDILQPGMRQRTDEQADTTFYDAEDSWQGVARYGTSDTPSDFAGEDIQNYSDTYIHSEENISYVENYENFSGVDLYGNEVKVFPNKQHDEYEEQLDEEGMMSILGDVPYSEADSYIEEE
ncbi:TraR/DksA C4-type zinc finger protein [Pontibacillus salicampi]|uniref:TraR/DksA C4-type zinc finger protein n=1 Tax=Pontibacillus salicampi TaxID=1449801 RepID=A0ABV6LKH9_9BACI